MERIWNFIKRWAFLEGLVVGALLCHYFYREFRIDEIKDKYDAKAESLDSRLATKDSELQALNDKFTKAALYEQKYIAEASRALTLERKNNDMLVDNEALSRRYSDVLAMKWEEKFNTEKLSRVATEEEAASLRQRLTGAEARQPTADPLLLKQIDILTEQNRIVAKERDELRKLYVATPKEVSVPSVAGTVFPVGALAGVIPSQVGGTIIGIMRTLKKPVDTSSFINALAKAMPSDRASVVNASAEFLTYPLTPAQLEAISHQLMPSDSGAAMQVLLREQAKH